MSGFTLLTTPLIINNVTYNDGDYVNISLPMPNLNTISGTPMDGDFANLTGPNYGATFGNQTISLQGSAYKMQYSPAPQTFTYNTYDTSGAQTSYEQTGTGTMSITPKLYQSNDGSSTMLSDATMAPQQAFLITRCKATPSGNVNNGAAIAGTYQQSDSEVQNTTISLSSDTRIILEYQLNNYVALRGVNGQYLHMKSVYTYDDPVMQGVLPNDNVKGVTLTYSSDPSELLSAQWQFYQTSNGSNTNIVLCNRGTGLYLNLQNANMAGQTPIATARYYGTGTVGINVISKYAATYYGNGWTQQAEYWEYVGQPYWRLNATSTSTNASQFTISRVAISTCDASTSPTNTQCLAKSSDPGVYQAIFNYCSQGNLGLCATCSAFFVTAGSAAAVPVNNVCERHPNDMTLCACVNYPPVYWEIIELLRINNTSFLPQCNASACAQGLGTTSWVANLISCISRICIQGLDLSGSNITIGNVNQNCALGSGTAASNTTTPNTNDNTAGNIFGNLLTNFIDFGNAALNYRSKIIGSFTISTILACFLIIAFLYLVLFSSQINIGALREPGVTVLLLFITQLLLFVH